MMAKEKQSEDGLSKALSSMDRVAAVELAHRQYLCLCLYQCNNNMAYVIF